MQQVSQSGGDAVASKEIDYAYDAIGDVTGRSAYNFVGVGPHYDIATSAISYNPLGLITGIAMTSDVGQVSLDHLTYSYDTLGRVSTFGSIDGTASYGYDTASQLTSASYIAASGHVEPANFSVTFDPNGNRTSANGVSTTVGKDNHLTSDGTFNFAYDPAGNLTTRTRISTTAANDYKTVYLWDYRNRLTDVEFYNNAGVLTQHVHYAYDVWNNIIKRDLDPDGSGTYTQIVHYVWDGNNVVLAFNGADQLIARYLNGPNTSAYDQYYSTLAEEDVTSTSQGGTLTFPQLDPQGSVTDIADNSGNLADHIVYVSTGGVFSESHPTVPHIAGFQGGYIDATTGMEKFGQRWLYVPDAFWASEDPIGLAGGDPNMTRVVGNDPTNSTDPSGLAEHRKKHGMTVGKHQEGERKRQAQQAAKAARDADAEAKAKNPERVSNQNLDEQIENLKAQRKSLERRNLKRPCEEVTQQMAKLDERLAALKNLRKNRKARGGFVAMGKGGARTAKVSNDARVARKVVRGAGVANDVKQCLRASLGGIPLVPDPVDAAFITYDTINTPYTDEDDTLIGPHGDAFGESVINTLNVFGFPSERPWMTEPPPQTSQPTLDSSVVEQEEEDLSADDQDYLARLKAIQEDPPPLAPPD